MAFRKFESALIALTVAMSVLAIATSPASAGKIGTEFRVNTYTADEQAGPAVAGLTGGGFVIAWKSSGQDGSGYGIYAQRYAASGAPLGPEFQVNTYETKDQTDPAIAALAGGGFVISWTSKGQDGASESVRAQRYDSTGAPIGPEFRIDTGFGDESYLAGLADGGFVATWRGATIYGRLFDDTGAPRGDAFAATPPTRRQYRPVVCVLTGGRFVIAWRRQGSFRAQLFDGTAQPLGKRFGATGAGNPSVAATSIGGFVVRYGKLAQEYDKNAQVIGDPFSVGSLAAIAGLPDGRIVTVWPENGNLYGQYFKAHHGGPKFQINTGTLNHSEPSPAVAGLLNGGFIATWKSFGAGPDFYDVFGQQYGP